MGGSLLHRALEETYPRVLELLSKASRLWGPPRGSHTVPPQRTCLECFRQRPGPGCAELSQVCRGSGGLLSLRFYPPPPATEGSPHLLGLWGSGLPWPPGPGAGLTPAMLCPCSNGILYQYPDRTDVTPLLSVNMG